MNVLPGKKVVLLGMMSRMPVAGNVWLIAHYMVGLQRLGYDPYYVEAHARTPTMLMTSRDDDGSARAAAFIAGVMERFGFGDRWAFHALHDDGRCYGMTEGELSRLYDSATLIVNMHGGTVPRPEHYATGRLVYLGTDPVEVEVELFHGHQGAIEFLEPHCAFFTWGENYGNPDCRVPVSDRFHFVPTRAPVVMDLWQGEATAGGRAFTTIGNWRQAWRTIEFQGETYHWSKHLEFLKFLDVPTRTAQEFELALGSYTEDDQRMLEEKGWRVRSGLEVSLELDRYRDYIAASRGEFTVAKDQNVRLRSGWFSERSSQYLASGRPVITQDTGFGNVLPTGEGLFAFSTVDEIEGAVEAINSDYDRHCRAATEVAREYFSYEVVLPRMLHEVGLPNGNAR